MSQTGEFNHDTFHSMMDKQTKIFFNGIKEHPIVENEREITLQEGSSVEGMKK